MAGRTSPIGVRVTADTSKMTREFRQAARAADRLALDLDKANVELKQSEIRAAKAAAAHAAAAKAFGAESRQAYEASLRSAKATNANRDAALRASEAHDKLAGSHDRVVEHADNAEKSSRRLGRTLDRDVTRGLHAAGTAAGRTAAAFGLLAAASSTVSLAPLLGLAAAAPGALAAIGQVGGTLALSFGGITDAVKALGDAQDATAQDAQKSAKKQSAAADQVRAAQERVRSSTLALRRAGEQAAEANKNATERVRDAELRLADQQRSAKRAQTELNDARKEARQRLLDLRQELAAASLNEADAALSVREAHERLQEVLKDPRATQLERERAALSEQQAENSLKQVRTRNKALQEEAETTRKAGVEGSQQVIRAREGVADAERSVAEAARDSRRAQQEAARTSVEGSRAVAEAARDLRLAQEEAARAGKGTDELSSSAVKLKTAFDKLSPPAQRFAKFLFSLKGKLDQLRATAAAGFLPALQVGMQRALRLFPEVNDAVAGTASVLGSLAKRGGELLGSGPFRRDFAAIAKANTGLIRDLGDAALALVQPLVDIAVVARPLTEWVGRLAKRWAENFAGMIATARASGGLREFFRVVREDAQHLANIVEDVFGIVFDLARAAFPTSTGLLGSLDGAIDRLHDFTSSTKGQAKLRKFFEDMKKAVQGVLDALGPAVAAIGSVAAAIADFAGKVADLAKHNPKLKALVGHIAAIGAAAFVASKLGIAQLLGGLLSLTASNPALGLTVLAVAGIGAAAVVAYAKNEPFRNSVDRLGKSMKKAGEQDAPKLKGSLKALGGTVDNNKKQLKAVRDFLTDKLAPAFVHLGNFAIRYWIGALRLAITIQGQMVRAVDKVGKAAGAAGRALGAFGSSIVVAIRSGLGKAAAWINKFSRGIEGIAGKLGLHINLPEIVIGGGTNNKNTIKRATGGAVPGSSNGPNRDSVHAMLVPGEYVLNRRMVGEAGGVGALEAWRTRSSQHGSQSRPGDDPTGPGFATGGAVNHLNRIGGVIGKLSGLNAGFLAQLRRYAAGIGRTITVTSGYRSLAQQARLFAQKPGLAAPPGRSNHNYGLAADIVPQLGGTRLGGKAAKYGLRFPMSYEPWHIEPANAKALRGLGGLLGGGLLPNPGALIAKAFSSVIGGVRGVPGIAGQLAGGALNKLRGAALGRLASLATSGTNNLNPIGGGGLSAAEKWIIGKESGGRTTADNPTSTAFGLGQLLLANRRLYAGRLGVSPSTTNYGDQLAMFRMYVKDRYGTAANAQAFWQAHGWYNQGGPVRSYDQGGMLPRGLSMAYNGTGRPERVVAGGGSGVSVVVDLRGATFLGDARSIASTLAPHISTAIRTDQRRRGVTPSSQIA